MPRKEIPVEEILREGLTPGAATVADPGNGHYVGGNDGTIFIEVDHFDSNLSNAATITVAANPALSADGLTISPLVLDIPPGAVSKFGPFRPNTFNQDTTYNRVFLDPDSAMMEIRAYKLTAARA